MTDVSVAAGLARDHLAAPLPRRWLHVEAVADKAARMAAAIDLDSTRLVCAAWLHDIGYAPDIVDTGFHPLDGARFLQRAGWPAAICALVAHHTCALLEAGQRGLRDELLRDFCDEADVERDALWAADATTGPDGQRMTLDERVAEVERRYGVSHLVARCMRSIRPELDAAITRTRARLGDQRSAL